RLAAGIQVQLAAAGYADDARALAQAAAAHYAWWTGHPSVTPDRVCAESDAILAALTVVAPLAVPPAEDEQSTAVQLARTAVPAFAAGLAFGAWEQALRAGAEAARLSGEVADQAYFHHELGVHAILAGQLDRARSELETSIGLRGALADKRGTLAGRRALALVADRSGEALAATPAFGTDFAADAPKEQVTRYPDTLTTQKQRVVAAPPTVVLGGTPSGAGAPTQHRRTLRGLARRNLVAVGAGALLVAVLGTVVGLGATSDKGADNPSRQVTPSTSTDGGDSGGGDSGGTGGAGSGGGGTGGGGHRTSRPSPSASGPGESPGHSEAPTPSESADPTSGGTTGGGTGGTTGGGTGGTTSGPSSSPSHSSPSPSTSGSPKPSDSSPPASESPSSPPPTPDGTPTTSTSASGPAPSRSGESPSASEPVI
ncbi:ATP-binding protein, partial [Streptomyces sp. S6]